MKIALKKSRYLPYSLCMMVFLLIGCMQVNDMKSPCKPKDGEHQICYFPLRPAVDGNLDETAWRLAHWEQVDFEMSKDRYRPDDNDDASFRFACVADNDNLYFGFEVIDDKLSKVRSEGLDGGELEDNQYYQDDSLEIVMDQDTEALAKYDGNDFQIIFKPESIGEDDFLSAVRLKVGGQAEDLAMKGRDTGSSGYSRRETHGWIAELAVPLDNVKGTKGWHVDLKDGRTIRFQTGYNDNDGTDGRDHKITWGKSDRNEDDSFRNPALLDELELCQLPDSLIDAGIE